MKKEIILSIKNGKNKKQKAELLCWIMNGGKQNDGLPDGVSAYAIIKEKGKTDIKIKYAKLMEDIACNPIALRVMGSTDNRRLVFCFYNIYGEINPIFPQITPKGVLHYLDPHYVWNEKKHNIADSKEGLIMDGKEIIYLTLKPKELFEIRFNLLAVKVELDNLRSKLF